MSHSTVRLGNGELDAVTELHRVNLSPENRFEASPLRGNSTATGTFRRHVPPENYIRAWRRCSPQRLGVAMTAPKSPQAHFV
jgi:hypothetical protein